MTATQDYFEIASRALDGKKLSMAHIEWLEKVRHISSETAAREGLWSDGPKLMFPFFANGTLAYNKYRNPNAKSFGRDRSGVSTALYRLEALREAPAGETLIITEGEMDTLACLEAGLPWVVSVPDGAQQKEPGRGKIFPGDDKTFDWLWSGNRVHPFIDKFARIVLAVDNDKPGKILRDELALRLDRTRCYSVSYPEGCKDAGDVIVKHGPEALAKLIREAKPIVPDRLLPVLDIPASSWTGLSTGWSELDEHLKVGFPELMVVLGTPNSGKSQFVTALIANVARVHGLKASILALEDAAERLQSDLCAYHAAWRRQTQGVPVPDDAEEWINGHFFSLSPREVHDDGAQNVEWLGAMMQEASQRHGHRVFVIDPWNEVEHLWARGETETTYTAKAIRWLKTEARRLQLLLIIVVHPTKGAATLTSIEDMSLYDAAGSSAWNDKADHGIILRRPDLGRPELHVKIAKVRDQRRGGRPGLFTMKFNPRTASYEFVKHGIDGGSDAR